MTTLVRSQCGLCGLHGATRGRATHVHTVLVVVAGLLGSVGASAQAPDEPPPTTTPAPDSDTAPDAAFIAPDDGRVSPSDAHADDDEASDPEATEPDAAGAAAAIPSVAEATEDTTTTSPDATAAPEGAAHEATVSIPFDLHPSIYGALVAGGITAATLVAVSLVSGMGGAAVLLDLHFNQHVAIDPWAGLFLVAPIFVANTATTAIGSAFVLEGRGPMAAALAGTGAAFAGAAAGAGAVIGLAVLLEDGLPLARDLDPYLWGAGVTAFVVGTLAGTAAAAGVGAAFAPSPQSAAPSSTTDSE